ncbi:MinD superfamily P-loop ATPase [Methanolinea mesophila]|uniref:nucleotide-binding protein n=1 Tax=Methanolinea mesophila TaxID=547055 RepID=UPI001FD83A23|nr:ATP-binding protein [Methanolinea mesophila]MBP1928486.1 MinD superfamily P-loop ATPase [Methanolinea mesophila]
MRNRQKVNDQMRIVVASGKGGTGKTLVTANLAFVLSQKMAITLEDCDVEEPNLHLYFPSSGKETVVTITVPGIDESACTLCGKCGEACRYGAITALSDRVLIFPDLCHSCGGCALACPALAIEEVERPIGMIKVSFPLPGLKLISGRLNEGEVQTVAVIREVRTRSEDDPLVIADAPPGTSCPLVETLEGCNYCLLVTEPTPFGLHDLALAAEVVQVMGVPAGIVINKNDGNDGDIVDFAKTHSLPVLMSIPLDREIARVHNNGDLVCLKFPEWRERFAALAHCLLGEYAGGGA